MVRGRRIRGVAVWAPAIDGIVRRFVSIVASDTFARLATLVVAGVLWEFGANASTSLLIPSFSDTARALVDLVTRAELWEALALSNQALVIGFAASVVIGIPLGLAMGRFRGFESFADFYLAVLLVTPMAAIMPLIIMATGLGLVSRVILVVLSSIVVVVANTRAGVRQVDAALIDMARSLQASELQIWRRILLPGSMPGIMAGLRLGLSQAVGAMIIIELLMIAVGIGALMLEFRGRFMADFLYASVVIVVLEALLLVVAVDRLERLVAPWRFQ